MQEAKMQKSLIFWSAYNKHVQMRSLRSVVQEPLLVPYAPSQLFAFSEDEMICEDGKHYIECRDMFCECACHYERWRKKKMVEEKRCAQCKQLVTREEYVECVDVCKRCSEAHDPAMMFL